ERIQEKVRTDIVRAEVRSFDPSAEEMVSLAAQRGVALVLEHRKAISKLATLEEKLLEELSDEPKKLYITQYQGEIVSEEVGIDVVSRAGALLNLAGVQAKRIQLERQAFNLDPDPARNLGGHKRTKEERDAVVDAFTKADS
ncbi:MAG: hypothetical protein KKB38_20610, partial [Gammaproteobacteria bacterium]|nr:hypothetical protein [Gammaproteobacteria bacterium]